VEDGSIVKRFAICFAVALLVSMSTPAWPRWPRWPEGGFAIYEVFFPLARYLCFVLLVAVALYAAVLFVEWLRAKRRS